MNHISETHENNTFPDWTIDDFDNITEDHTFSFSYRRKKKKLLKEYRCTSGRCTSGNRTSGRTASGRRLFKLPAAAAVGLICVVGAGTVFAAASLYRFTVEENAAHSFTVGIGSTGSVRALSGDNENTGSVRQLSGDNGDAGSVKALSGDSGDQGISGDPGETDILDGAAGETGTFSATAAAAPAELPAEFPDGLPAEFPAELPAEFPDGLPAELPAEFPAVEVSFGYLPDDLEKSGKGEYYYIGTDGKHGYYTDIVVLDKPAVWTEFFTTGAETLKLSGHDALLVERQYTTDENWANRSLYISFPEEHRVVCIWAWGECEKEELLDIGEGVSLKETGGSVALADQPLWSDLAAVNNSLFDNAETTADEEKTTVATAEEMSRLHVIGESFPASPYSGQNECSSETPETGSDNETPEAGSGSRTADPVRITVTDAAVYDDLSALTCSERIPEDWKSLTGPDGRLMTDDLITVRFGDGENTLDEIINREPKTLKLLQVTVRYENTGSEDVHDEIFLGTLMRLSREGKDWRINTGSDDPALETNHENHLIGPGEMYYYDITGGMRNNNHITELKSGGSQDVHMAWIVDADSLDELYLNLNPSGNWDRFTEEDLAMGYVDLNL